jgi:hypothetical protein
MAKQYHYLLSCPDRPWWTNEDPGHLIQEMADQAVDVSYERMLRNCVGLVEWALGKGYDRSRTQGLTLKDDWHVGFYQSVYDGMRCYFVRWSGMEFIWVHEDDLAARGLAVAEEPEPAVPTAWWRW